MYACCMATVVTYLPSSWVYSVYSRVSFSGDGWRTLEVLGEEKYRRCSKIQENTVANHSLSGVSMGGWGRGGDFQPQINTAGIAKMHEKYKGVVLQYILYSDLRPWSRRKSKVKVGFW